jgi:acyl transferase domain-containing protein/phosphopantetheinyl transferase
MRPAGRPANNAQASRTANKIAIVGMSCLFPGASNLSQFWTNIVNGVDATRDATAEEWNPEKFYNQTPTSFEHIYCKRGGFITELADFDPLKYGVMPNSISGSDPDQLLALRVATEALADAGYSSKEYDGNRAEVILGRTSAPGGGSMNMIYHGETVHQVLDVVKSLHPEYSAEQLKLLEQGLRASLRNCSSDTIPAVMPNILAGRIAGRLGFKGKSTVLDSACASSLIAVEMAVSDLLSGSCDLALAGGIHVNAFAAFYQMFCGLGALSKQEKIRPYDDKADGTLLGEGLGMVVLKRYEDAIKDDDRIYAVITGIASSSDGQGTSMLAPSVDGEALALKRAYEMSGVSPATIGLLEGHGTGTPSGDAAEIQAIQKVYGESTDGSPWCAIGSVKSMIGHTQAASGVAGLIKTALALYHKILPPTLNVETPTSQIDWQKSPCYINSKTRTWIHAKTPTTIAPEDRSKWEQYSSPRRAAVSAFGFGGVNAHTILEEHDNEYEGESDSLLLEWETELCLFVGKTHEELVGSLTNVRNHLVNNPSQALRNVAYSLATKARKTLGKKQTVSIIASTVQDLQRKIDGVLNAFDKDETPNLADVYYVKNSQAGQGKLAFVMPGLGAAYPNMLQDLCYHFPEVRIVFDYIDILALHCQSDFMPSRRIFPRGEQGQESIASLAAMDSAVVNVLMAEWALYTVLQNVGIEPDALLGCSTGEFATLPMSGAVNILDVAPLFYHLSTQVAKSVSKEKLANLRSIMLVADHDNFKETLKDIDDLYLSAALCPSQTMLSGSKEAVAEAVKSLTAAGFEPQPLPMAIPYHTPLVEGMVDPNLQEIQDMELGLPKTPIWSCSRVDKYPDDTTAIREITTKLFTQPIMLKKTIEAMYADGVTMFVEVGPKGVLTPLIGDTLQDKEHLAVASNTSYNSSITQLNHCLGELAAHGVNMQLDYLFARRVPEFIEFDETPKPSQRPAVRLDLKFPQLRLPEDIAKQLRASAAQSFEAQAPAAQSFEAQSNDYHVETEESPEQPLDVVQTYLAGMAEFHNNLMGMQEEVMRAYLLAQQQAELNGNCESDSIEYSGVANGFEYGAADGPGYGEANGFEYGAADGLGYGEANGFECTAATEQLQLPPFLRNGLVRCELSEQDAEAELFVTLDNHRYLLDHAIGGNVSCAAGIERVYLLPLTVAVEAMTEIASLLIPGRPVLRVSSVKAARRIRVGREGSTLRLRAKKIDSYTFETSIDQIGAEQYAGPSMSCRVEFGEYYPAAPLLTNSIAGARLATLTPTELYQPHTMFHGPRMQSVVALHSLGKRAGDGYVVARPAQDWFPDDNDPKFLIDPLLLDNSTQIVLFYLFEEKEDVSALLPFLVESLELFTDLSNLRGTFRVSAHLSSMTSRGTEGDVFIIDNNNVVLAKFTGINSRRIILSESWKEFIAQPQNTFLSDTMPYIEAALGRSDQWSNAILQSGQLPEDESTLTWCLDYVLNNSERREFLALTNLPRKREWFCGRIAAKEAVRRLLKASHNLTVCSADIIVATNEQGQPYATGKWIDVVGAQPYLSISHKAGIAVALAAHRQASRGIGIDVEIIEPKENGFETLAFLPDEINESKKAAGSNKEKRVIQFWSAKEAVGKALGLGLSANPRSLKAQFLSENQDEARFSVSAQNGGPFLVHCLTYDRTVIAVTNLVAAG